MSAPSSPPASGPKPSDNPDRSPSSISGPEDLVDLLVFAPLGMALHWLENYPELVAKGRRQARFAKSLGQMALASAQRSSSDGRQSAPEPKPAPAQPSSAAPASAAEPSLPIIGYASMTAREAIAALAALSPDQLTVLRAAEVADRNRVTVLRAIDKRLV